MTKPDTDALVASVLSCVYPDMREAVEKDLRTALTTQAEQQAQEPVGYIDAEQLRRWESLRGTPYEVEERYYMPFSRKPWVSDMNDCTLPVYTAPVTGQREVMLMAAEICEKLAADWAKAFGCPDAYDCRDAIRTAAAKLPESQIVGWMVHKTADIESAALYPLAEKDTAFDAAKRWGANITALAIHPDAPDCAAQSKPQGEV